MGLIEEIDDALAPGTDRQELRSVLRRCRAELAKQDRPGNHIFFNGVCKCGQRPTDDPMLCTEHTYIPREPE